MTGFGTTVGLDTFGVVIGAIPRERNRFAIMVLVGEVYFSNRRKAFPSGLRAKNFER